MFRPQTPLFPWSREKIEHQGFSVYTTAANIDSDVPHIADPPVVVVSRHQGLGMRHHHLGPHLLAGVEV